MKLGTIVTAENGLKKLQNHPMAMKDSLKVNKTLDVFFGEIKRYHEEKEKGVKKYGKADKDGMVSISQTSKEWPKFLKELEDLLQVEVGLDYEGLDITLFDTLVVSPKEMKTLEDVKIFKEG